MKVVAHALDSYMTYALIKVDNDLKHNLIYKGKDGLVLYGFLYAYHFA